MSGISFAGPAGHRADATFSRGEHVLALLTVTGFTYRARKADLRCEVEVKTKKGQLVLREVGLPLIKGKAPTNKPGEVRGAARLALSPALAPGPYTVTIVAKDYLADKTSPPASGTFTIVGRPPRRSNRFTIAPARRIGDAKVPAGSVVPIAFELQGIATRAVAGSTPPQRSIEVRALSQLYDAKNKPVGKPQKTRLVRGKLLFKPVSHPAELGHVLPRPLPPGKYRIAITATDMVSNKTARASLPIEVAPTTLAVVNPHLHDASHVSRVAFRFGEQAYLRFAVFGFEVKDGRANFAVDLAISGKTEGGIYFARKNAVTLSKSAAVAAGRRMRFAAQLPLTLPTVAPVGRYRVLLRVRDLNAKKDASRELDFGLRGKAPKRLGTFRIVSLETRLRPDLPALTGATYVGGRTYNLTLLVGGGRLRKVARVTYRAKVVAHLRLRHARTGKVVHESKNLFSLDRKFHYIPLRIPMSAKWTPPPNLIPGLYDLQIEALWLLDNRASQLSKRVVYLPKR
ncbi:MAG: hypothetical protein KC503_40010 [Myxococcales bacterium]|nr:hypothetical protein [Myxococcales bacterium]